MKWDEVPGYPQVDLPDEVTHTDMPEIEITSPHPVVPQPDAYGPQTNREQKIGFR